MHELNLQSILVAVALCAGTAAQATPANALPLKTGTYVVSSYKPCEEAPLAAVKEFDGKALLGPHESQCTTTIVSRRGHTYQVSTECLAHGDGTPEAPSTWSETVQVRSSSRLAVVRHGKPVEYELCPGFR